MIHVILIKLLAVLSHASYCGSPQCWVSLPVALCMFSWTVPASLPCLFLTWMVPAPLPCLFLSWMVPASFPCLFLTWDIEVGQSESSQLQLSKPQTFPFFLREFPFAGALGFISKAPYSLTIYSWHFSPASLSPSPTA